MKNIVFLLMLSGAFLFSFSNCKKQKFPKQSTLELGIWYQLEQLTLFGDSTIINSFFSILGDSVTIDSLFSRPIRHFKMLFGEDMIVSINEITSNVSTIEFVYTFLEGSDNRFIAFSGVPHVLSNYGDLQPFLNMDFYVVSNADGSEIVLTSFPMQNEVRALIYLEKL
jgi:hypothetical protein